jgi:hypothetical protein
LLAFFSLGDIGSPVRRQASRGIPEGSLPGTMVYLTKDRSFAKGIADRHGMDSMQHSVARIYGRPDEMVDCDPMETWYYYNEKVAFVFEGAKISQIQELKSC